MANTGDKFNEQAYRHAISMIESSGGKYLETGINPKTGKHYSSAAGKYHFLYNLIKKDPSMKGVTKRQFMNSPELQEKIMDKALSGNLRDYTYGPGYAEKIKKEFGSDYDTNALTALVHFVGAGNSRKFLKDPEKFIVPGTKNLTADQYLSKFNKYFNEYVEKNNPVESTLQGLDVRTNNNSIPIPAVNKDQKATEPQSVWIDKVQPQKKEANTIYLSNEELAAQEARNNEVVKGQADRSVNKSVPQVEQTEIDTQLRQRTQPRRTSVRRRDLGSEPTSISRKFIDRRSNQLKAGGFVRTGGVSDLVTLFEGGGTHAENPNGGIPQGIGANGKPNLVEEGETKWNDYIFSNAITLDGNLDLDGSKVNVFEDGGKLGGKKGKTTSESNEIGQSKLITSAVRKMLPLPQSAAQLVASLANEDSTYTTKDGGLKANEHLYRSVRNAVKRTGKNKGGTEYEDYSPQIDNDLNSLRMNAADMALGSILSPELEAATTYGRVSYDFDPKTGNVKIYDTYDFNKTPRGKGVYSNIRSAAGDASEGILDSNPKLIGKFNMNDNPDDVKFMDVVNNVLNPIDALDINYSSIKKATNKASKIGSELYEKGKKFINSFEDGGSLTAKSEAKSGPIMDESSKYPMKFTKTQSQFHKTGEDMYVDDIRDQHTNMNPLNTSVGIGEVDFRAAAADKQAQEFADRYNDPTTREMMKSQTGLTDYDIDNMILRGLDTEKVIGGNVPNSKASYSNDDRRINMGEDYASDSGVETHERVHASGFDAAQGVNLINVLGNTFQQEGGMNKKYYGDTMRYLNQPHEAYGNFVEFRGKLGLKPGEKITEDQLRDRAKKKGLTAENFYRAFDNKNITEALNTIAYEGNQNDINNYKLA